MVTVIKYEALGKGKLRIQFDTGLTGIFYRGEANRASLSLNSEMEDSEYQKLIKEVLGKRAKKRAMHLLEQMDRTERQIRDKLAQGEYPEACIDEAISYLKSFHYLDDRRYAQTYIRYRQDKMSRNQLLTKLLQKGVPRATILEALEEEYSGDEALQIRALLEKKHYNPECCDDGEFRRIYQYLLRRGFRSNDILKEMKNTIY